MARASRVTSLRSSRRAGRRGRRARLRRRCRSGYGWTPAVDRREARATRFVPADRATPNNPAVQVLSELLPADAERGLCLTCHGFSASAPYPFAETTGIFPNVGSFRMNPASADVSPHGTPLLTAPRRELVVCTQVALSWTASRVRSDRQDVVTLYSAQFRDILGATVRHRRKGVVEVWVLDGPELSFRVTPEAADALQARVDRAAQSQ